MTGGHGDMPGGHAGLVGGHTGALGAPTPDAAWWVALVGLPVMGYLLAAGSVALVRTMAPIRAEPTPAAGCHEPRPTGPLTQRLDQLGVAAMDLGMFWMSVGLMVPLIPWLVVLQA